MKINTYSDFINFPEPKNLCNYYYFEHAFSDDQITQIVDYASTHERTHGTAGGEVNPDYRNSKISWLSLNDDTEWLYKKVGEMARKANDEMWNFSLVGMAEKFQFGEYDSSDKGHYDWHLDMSTGELSRRKISIVVQLTDPEKYEGGDLQIMMGRDPMHVPKGKGNVCLFPSYALHRVTPVTRGKRQSLVLWVSGEPFR